MLNMIKLDWLGMKCYHKRIIIMPLVICFYGLVHEAVIIPAIAFMMLSFSVNPFMVEEKGKLDNLYLTLPVTRKNIVNARFGLSLIMQFMGLAVGTIITVLLSALLYGRTIFTLHTFKADIKVMFLILCCSLLLYAITSLSMFPMLFKIGYAKGKALGYYIPIVAVSIAVFSLYMLWYFNDAFQIWLISSIEWAFANTVWTAVSILVIAAFILAVSYILSCKAYTKRDF